ncbi:transposase [Bradyrhizobium sp. SBR1B]|uniref:transposase n=1 Tax=Bradyrhizobium sp. SBR1B TaxID=2663836 RepID=UPI0017ADF819|nr:transposase [Bradyrhizobium sp. SBR1B]MBB4383678.1 transposase-like protein [Bradyrhizobium sp. SBR1B]
MRFSLNDPATAPTCRALASQRPLPADIHWRKIRTKRSLERIMKKTRRRTRVFGALPVGQSCLSLAVARLRHIAGTAWSTKCYMNMRPLYRPQLSESGAVA